MYPPPAPAAKSGSSATKILLIVLGVISALCLLLCGGGALMMNNVMKQVSPMVGCMMTVSMLETSTEAYVLDHNGKMPNAASWEDDLAPYYERLYTKNKKKFDEMKKVPMVGGMFDIQTPGETFQCGKGDKATGFAYNADLSGADRKALANPSRTPLFFEVSEIKRNNNQPGTFKASGNPPDIMNEKREWIVFYVEGNENPFGNSRSSSSSNMELDPEDARDPSKK